MISLYPNSRRSGQRIHLRWVTVRPCVKRRSIVLDGTEFVYPRGLSMARGKTRAGVKRELEGQPELQEVIPAHRGRIQVQGMDMAPELSHAWARSEPPTARASIVELDSLHDQCTASQQAHRREAFPKARRYIEGAAGKGVDAPVTKTCEDRSRPNSAKDARVDIEVLFGRAFV